jgi:DNA-binding ferritin-like protein
MTFSGSFESTPSSELVASEPTVIVQELEETRVTLQDLLLQLVALSSHLHQIYTQAHLIHLNVEGPLFLPIHEFLKEQYDAHVMQFDQVAEFVRTMDTLLPMCEKGLLSAYKGFKHVKSYDMREMLITYLGNLEKVGMQAKEIGEMAREVQAPDVENYMAELVGAMFKASWMIKSTLRG